MPQIDYEVRTAVLIIYLYINGFHRNRLRGCAYVYNSCTLYVKRITTIFFSAFYVDFPVTDCGQSVEISVLSKRHLRCQSARNMFLRTNFLKVVPELFVFPQISTTLPALSTRISTGDRCDPSAYPHVFHLIRVNFLLDRLYGSCNSFICADIL